MVRLTRHQVRELDRRAIEHYRIPGVVLMENAARAAADVACEILGNKPRGRVLIICGGGNNGGDGLALARHLHNRHHHVRIGLFFDPMSFQHEALTNWEITRAMRLPAEPATPEMVLKSDPTLVVDAIFGTGLNQNPRDPFPQLAEAMQSLKKPILAIDLPSGLDADTGEPYETCIRATATVTLACEKAGFTNPVCKEYLGQYTVADIGCPRELLEQVQREVPPH